MLKAFKIPLLKRELMIGKKWVFGVCILDFGLLRYPIKVCMIHINGTCRWSLNNRNL